MCIEGEIAMAIKINKYIVRHKGVMYGPGQPGGQLLTGLSEDEEARLTAGSGGSIEKYKPYLEGEDGSEVIIPSPGRRGAALELWQKAGQYLGVVPHAAGGGEPTSNLVADADKGSADNNELLDIDPGDLIKPSSSKAGKENA